MKPNEEHDLYHPGAVLAAAPELSDPNFRQTLVYLAEHSKDGAFGLVMNRPSGKTVGDISPPNAVPDSCLRIPVMQGGPVHSEQLLFAVFAGGERDSDLVCRIGLGLEEVTTALTRDNEWVRAFLGYSGWGEGQLEGELAQQAWVICPPSTFLFNESLVGGLWSVFVTGDNRWRNLLSFLPDQPELN
jgi:putative transcriptional regulator